MGERRVLDLLSANAPLVATVIAFAVVAMRALAVAHGDLTTAAVLLMTMSIAQAFAAIAVTTVVTIVVLALGFTGSSVVARLRSRDPGAAWSASTVFLAALVIAVFAVPWPFIALALTYAVLNGWFLVDRTDRAIVRAAVRVGDRRVLAILLPCVASLVAVLFLWYDDPWLAREVVGVARERPTVGYVLAEDERWTTVLTHDDRRVVRVRTDDVETRTPCRGDLPPHRPVRWLWADDPGYPLCPAG